MHLFTVLWLQQYNLVYVLTFSGIVFINANHNFKKAIQILFPSNAYAEHSVGSSFISLTGFRNPVEASMDPPLFGI